MQHTKPTPMTARLTALTALLLAALTLLAACGGDDDGDNGVGRIASDNIWEAPEVTGYAFPAERFTNEAPSAEGRHFSEGEFAGFGSVAYETDPPTSGRHVGQLAAPGVSDLAIPDEIAVHQMEHGYVVVWYNCNAASGLTGEACTELRNDLSAIVQPSAQANVNVVMSPDPTMEHRIALTAWQYMDTMEEVDRERIQAFFDAFECNYDPEGTCG